MKHFNLIVFSILFLATTCLTVFGFLHSFMFGFICLLLTFGVGVFLRQDILEHTKNAPDS